MNIFISKISQLKKIKVRNNIYNRYIYNQRTQIYLKIQLQNTSLSRFVSN